MGLERKYDLDLLVAVERGEAVSQRALSRNLGIAVGLMNAVVKRAVRKGFVKVKEAPAKRYLYYLTPAGFAEKTRLVGEYLEFSLGFFRQAREAYTLVFDRAAKAGLRRIVLVGGGELAEIATIAAAPIDVELVGIVDPEADTDELFGLPVSRSAKSFGPVDAFVITDAREAQATFDRLARKYDPTRILVPELLHVTVDGEQILATSFKGQGR